MTCQAVLQHDADGATSAAITKHKAQARNTRSFYARILASDKGYVGKSVASYNSNAIDSATASILVKAASPGFKDSCTPSGGVYGRKTGVEG